MLIYIIYIKLIYIPQNAIGEGPKCAAYKLHNHFLCVFRGV